MWPENPRGRLLRLSSALTTMRRSALVRVCGHGPTQGCIRPAQRFELTGRLTFTGDAMPRLTRIFTSARRFSFRPARVLLSATGIASPYPNGSMIRRKGMS